MLNRLSITQTTLFAFFIFCSFCFISDSYRTIHNENFKVGERYEYKVKYSFVPIGLATIDVNEKIFTLNNRPCFRINFFGRTTGVTEVFKIRNTYLSYVDTAAIIPHKFIYSAREGNYKRDQTIVFNQLTGKATRTEKEAKKTFDVPKNIQDVISGFYYLRTIDYRKFAVGQTTEAPLFFADELYQMKVKYRGKRVLKTDFGKINVLLLNPVLPPNSLFEGEEAIKIYVSDDKNKVPLLMEVELKVGSATMELKNFSGNKYPFSFKK